VKENAGMRDQAYWNGGSGSRPKALEEARAIGQGLVREAGVEKE